MEKPKVTIGIILFTGCEKYLPYSLPSLFKQNYENIELFLRDQSPDHGVYTWLKENMPEAFDKATVQQGENRMHSGGHNDLMNQMTGQYYIVASNDMLYPENFVSEVVEAMEKPEHTAFGSASPKLMQWAFDKASDLEASKTNILDSCGIGIKKSHHFMDLGQGQEDKGQYDQLSDIFGASGALTILRKSVIDQIKYRDEIYDELLHYKNDVELAYRMQWAGHKCLFLPKIKVYHDRQVAGDENLIKARKNISKWAKESSVLGHEIVMQKHYSKQFSLGVRLQTFFYHLAKKIFILIKEPYLLKTYKKVKTLKAEIQKKKEVMQIKVKPARIESLMQ